MADEKIIRIEAEFSEKALPAPERLRLPGPDQPRLEGPPRSTIETASVTTNPPETARGPSMGGPPRPPRPPDELYNRIVAGGDEPLPAFAGAGSEATALGAEATAAGGLAALIPVVGEAAIALGGLALVAASVSAALRNLIHNMADAEGVSSLSPEIATAKAQQEISLLGPRFQAAQDIGNTMASFIQQETEVRREWIEFRAKLLKAIVPLEKIFLLLEASLIPFMTEIVEFLSGQEKDTPASQALDKLLLAISPALWELRHFLQEQAKKDAEKAMEKPAFIGEIEQFLAGHRPSGLEGVPKPMAAARGFGVLSSGGLRP